MINQYNVQLTSSTEVLLEVTHLSMKFGGLVAINDLSFLAMSKQITAIIGPNGAGKTTVFNCLTGFYKPSIGCLTLYHPVRGPIFLERMEGFQVARDARVARTFQNIRLFPRMSVLENLIVAQHNRLTQVPLFAMLTEFIRHSTYHQVESMAVSLARYWLVRVGLIDRADQEACSLPYGDQRKLEIARAMCTQPLLLCLDEPAAGLNLRETQDLKLLLSHIRDSEGVSILLIEHDMSVVMDISDQIIVLDHGQKIASGPPTVIRTDPIVIHAYLGRPETEEIFLSEQKEGSSELTDNQETDIYHCSSYDS